MWKLAQREWVAFLLQDVAELAARLEQVVVEPGLEQAVLAARAAWQQEVMQSVRLAEEFLARTVRPGRPASRPLDFLLRAVPRAEQTPKAQAVSAEAPLRETELERVEGNRRVRAVRILRGEGALAEERAVAQVFRSL